MEKKNRAGRLACFILISSLVVSLGCELPGNKATGSDSTYTGGTGSGLTYQEVALPYFNDFENMSLNGLEPLFGEWKIIQDTDSNYVISPSIVDYNQYSGVTSHDTINSDIDLFADFTANFTMELKFKRKMAPCWMVVDLSQQNIINPGVNNWLVITSNGLEFGRRERSASIIYPTGIYPDTWYTLKIQVVNANRYIISINGTSVIDYTDTGINTAAGYKFIKFEGNPVNGLHYLDDIKVTNP